MTADARSSDATTVTPAQAARPAQAPPAGAPPGRARARARTISALAGVGLVAIVLLSLGADRPEGIVLTFVVVAVVALRRRARGTGDHDEPVVAIRPDEPSAVLTAAVALTGRGQLPPPPVVTVVVLALLQIPVLVGIGATTLVFMDALLSPTGGATPPRVATVVGILVLAAIPSLVAAAGLWRGSEDARLSLLGLCRGRIALSVVSCLMFFTMFTPLVLLVIDHQMQRRLEDPRTEWWCALSPAPGPGSPPR